MAYNLITLIIFECDEVFWKCSFFKTMFQEASINNRLKGEKGSDSGG